MSVSSQMPQSALLNNVWSWLMLECVAQAPVGTMGSVQHIHLVGIGGAGMSGIAEMMVNLGYRVSGSDRKKTETTRYLADLGICIYHGHSASHIQGCDVLVYSSAIGADNEELCAARIRRIPTVRRAEMLAELMRFSYGIAVAGTHGKTTITSLIAAILSASGLDPTYVIGGTIQGSSHARLGKGRYFVAEADESDASFLHLTPLLSVVSNIDADHLENYQGDCQSLLDHFVRFVHQLPFYGLAVICVDDANVRRILPSFSRRIVTYGMDHDADYTALVVRQKGACTSFRMSKRDNLDWLSIDWRMLGMHNIRNALAAAAVADQLGVKKEIIQSALQGFGGLARRAEIKGELQMGNRKCLLVDDYAHHPVEIANMVRAVRVAYPERRLTVIYQPHRYTRLLNLFEDFCIALSEVDALLMLDVYPAGEESLAGADSRALCHAIRVRGNVDPVFVADIEGIGDLLERIVCDGDVLLVMGAGDVSALSVVLQHRYALDVS
ncbi:MAG: UDP-N-acetylmuramate--L-alanine ligase [Candidatus Eutrophobiaceae bacterium]